MKDILLNSTELSRIFVGVLIYRANLALLIRYKEMIQREDGHKKYPYHSLITSANGYKGKFSVGRPQIMNHSK